MAWTAPIDWSDADEVPSAIVTAAMLNEQIRENLGVLSTHTHTGAAGMGATTMTGLTLTALGTLTFADQSANPDAAGELQRNGNDILWYGSSVVNLSAADASAGTASLRSLSTSSTTAAAGNHTHTLSQEYASVSSETTVSVLGNDVEHEVITVSRAAADASNGLFLAGYFEPGVITQLGITYDMTFKIYAGATLLASIVTDEANQPFYGQVFRLPGSTSSVAYKVTAQWDRPGQTINAKCVLALLEVTF